MTIKSEEEARKYLDEVNTHLEILEKLSINAGLYRQASIWLTIRSAFIESMDEVATIEDMIKMYLDAKLRIKS